MTKNNKFTQVAENLIVTMDYTLTVEEKVIDSSEQNGPLRFMQGVGEIIPGLERQIHGLPLGENRTFTVPPAEGYGFSNNAHGFMGPPKFKDQLFDINSDLTITLKTGN